MKDDEAPPPYSPIDGSSSSLSSEINPLSPISYINSHLAALPNRIRQNQQARNAQQVETDLCILDHLTPILESFLADLGVHRAAPALATLILVPNSAVPSDAILSGIEERFQRQDEVGRIFRVDMQQNAKSRGELKYTAPPPSSEKTNSSNQGFTDWGQWEDAGSSSTKSSDLLWWEDEELAQRLASYLQPPSRPKPKAIVRGPVQAAAEGIIPAERVKRGWGLGWRRSQAQTANENSSTVSLPVSVKSLRPGTVENGDVSGTTGDQVIYSNNAEMKVKIEELAFRRENDFGIWESISGWAIVFTIRVDQ